MQGRRPPTSLIAYHCKGEIAVPKAIPRFHGHSAEPVVSTQGPAASLHQRNSHPSEPYNPKPEFTSGGTPARYRPGLFANRDWGPQGESQLNQTFNSLEAAKLAQNRAYAGYSLCRSGRSASNKRLSQAGYQQLKAARDTSVPAGNAIPSAWLYATKSEAAFARKHSSSHIDVFNPSPESPSWFQIHEQPNVKASDLTQAPGFDGTLTLLSRINGWITVTPKDKNRSKRLGRYGPYDKSKKGLDLRNVSDLAPAWMQTDSAQPTKMPQFRCLPGFSALRQGQKQTFLVDTVQPIKSQYSLGDFRHNVRTKEEAEKYMAAAEPRYKRLVEWPEGKNKVFRPVAAKVGALQE